MEIAFDPQFIADLNALEAKEAQRVTKTVTKYLGASDIPGLNLEKLKGSAGRQRLHTIRASQELRVLLAREGPIWVFLRAGHHDAIYDLAARSTFAVPRYGKPRLITLRSADPKARPVTPSASALAPSPERSIVAHWTDKELGEAGFDAEAVGRLRRATEDTLDTVWPDIDNATLDRVLECWEQSPDGWRQQRLLADEEADHKRFRDAIVQRGVLAGLSALLDADEFERLLSAPIEEWMIFLHPDQRALVDRRFAGPARVRGAAGTGKTVVALHRAAVLAKRCVEAGGGERGTPPVLFTTYIKSLPPVFENLYARLPNAVEKGVEFINIDKLARRICADEGVPARVDPPAAGAAFKDACDAVITEGSPLDQAGVTRHYLRHEVDWVLKGRGVDSEEAYLALERTGRRRPFTAAMREQTWRLRQEWDRLLAAAELEDFGDVVRRARDLARRRPEPTYECAVIDESQDLTLVGLQLVRALVNGASGEDRPDGLFLAGDGAQKIYPGGYTLAQAGLDVRGNSKVLRLNYRNTQRILDAAMACAGAEQVDDAGEVYARGDAAPETRRPGAVPMLVRAGDRSAQAKWAAERIRRIQQEEAGEVGLGDIGVFAPGTAVLDGVIGCLKEQGIRCQRLASFDGSPTEKVRVGTFHRAKGLEFKVVFLVDLSAFPRKWGAGGEEEVNEQQALEISQLFVAMTRARDQLFLLCNERPSDAVARALGHLEDHTPAAP